MTSFRCYDFLGRPGYLLYRTSIFLSYISIWSLTLPLEADGNYNLYMDRHEVHRLLGLSSDIYLVREGVVNEYALNFVVNVPSQIEKLHFSWQSLIKKPIHYELTIEFADFIALLQPSSNISTHGRVPQKLETFRIVLPCSGRLSTEVSVIIRFAFFYKSPKNNATVINIRRNKICLTKEFSGLNNRHLNGNDDREVDPSSLETNSLNEGPSIGPAGKGIIPGGNQVLSGTHNFTMPFIFQDPTPSLLLAGLLGGCAVTASIVFLTFFICLRRKLVTSSSSDSTCPSTCAGQSMDPLSLSNNSSPAYLLRQNHSDSSKWITLPGSESGSGGSTKDNFCSNSLLVVDPLQAQQLQQHQQQHNHNAHILRSGSPHSRSWSRNSYVTIASFWNDIFSTRLAGGGGGSEPQSQHHPHPQFQQQSNNNCQNNGSRASKLSNSTFISGNNNRTSTNSNNTSSTTTKGSDVSPYAYAHILGITPPPPPITSLPGNNIMPDLAAGLSSSSSPAPPLISSQCKQAGLANSHLLEWHSQAPAPPPYCQSIPGGGHIYSNHLYTFNPSPKHCAMPPHLNSPPPPPPPPPLPPNNPPNNNSCSQRMGEVPSSSQTAILPEASHSTEPAGLDCGGRSGSVIDENSSTAGRSGSESLIQIDGWQCRKNFTKETDVVERFL